MISTTQLSPPPLSSSEQPIVESRAGVPVIVWIAKLDDYFKDVPVYRNLIAAASHLTAAAVTRESNEEDRRDSNHFLKLLGVHGLSQNFYFVTERVENDCKRLSTIVREGGILPDKWICLQSLVWTAQIARCLRFMHRRGWLHCAGNEIDQALVCVSFLRLFCCPSFQHIC